MNRFAALFPGQLSEQAGMGEGIYRRFPYVREVVDEVSESSGVDLPAVFFGEGSPALHDDRPAQAGVFAVSVGVLGALEREHGLVPSWAAGYSLGTYAAMVAAGCLETRAALSVLLRVDELLAQRGPSGAMGVVIGMTREALAPWVSGVSNDPSALSIGNENAAQQLVVTGEEGPVEALLAAVRPHALRAERLPIRWPMHSPLLAPVADDVARFVREQVEVRAPSRCRLFAPMLGRAVETAEEAAEVLARQVSRPSRWAGVLAGMAGEGASLFAELGPGEVLSKMTRWTVRRARVAAVADPGSIERFAGLAADVAAQEER